MINQALRFSVLFLTLVASSFISSSLAQAIENPIVFGNARFTIIAPEAIRIEYSPSAHFIDEPSLFGIQRKPELTIVEEGAMSVATNGSTLVINTGKISLTYVNDGKPFSATNLKADILSLAHHDSRIVAQWTFGQKNLKNLGGTTNSLDHANGPVAIPEGLISRDGWYYVDDSQRFLMSPDFETGWVKAREANTDSIDGYLFGYGDNYKAALKALTRVSGNVPMPRKYVLGSWYSRWWPYTSDDYRGIALEFRSHDFPLDMLVADMDWHMTGGWTGLSWNRELFPDAENFLKDIHHLGLHITLNDHPQEGVKTYEDRYPDFMRAMGKDPASGEVLTYDAGNQFYIENLLKITHTNLENDGVDFWWLDWMGDDQPFNKMGWMNELYFRHTEERANLRGQSFSRWADWGDHRHPIHFSGDTKDEWDVLQFEVPFTSTASNVGCYFWSHDIGGFIQDINIGDWHKKKGELVARWTQFGAVSAAMRLHSANKSFMDKRPWLFPKDVEESMRLSFHLRSELFPYIYSAAWESHHDALPLVRPMYIEYPKLEDAYKNPQEYLFGDALLAAPITAKGDDKTHKGDQKVWFPSGRWFDWFTGEEHRALSSAKIVRDLNSFPLFAKGGVPILMQPYTERMASAPLDHLIVRVYPGEDGKIGHATLYEDDGDSRDYLKNGYALTDVSYSQLEGKAQIRVQPKASRFDRGLVRSYEIQMPGRAALKNVKIDGLSVPVNYDRNLKANKIQVLLRPTAEAFTVQVEL